MKRKEYNLLVEGWKNYLESGHYDSVGSELLSEGISDIWNSIKERFGNLQDGLANRDFKDSFEVILESLVPELTEAIREAQIDLHVQDWKTGFESRDSEMAFGSGGYPSAGDDEFEEDDTKSDDWNAGYRFRVENPGAKWSSKLEKAVVEQGIREWNDLVEIEVVSTSIKDFLNVLNPVELIKHMVHAVKKHGFKVALPVLVAEVVMHGLPIWGSKIFGPKAAFIISQIPITELMTPIYLKYVTGQGEKEEEPGYLDQYEDQYGDVPL